MLTCAFTLTIGTLQSVNVLPGKIEYNHMKTNCMKIHFAVKRTRLVNLFIWLLFLTITTPGSPLQGSSTSSQMLVPVPPPTQGCNNPIVGKGVVVDELAGSLITAFGSPGDWENLIDGDLTNYIAFNSLDLIGLGASSLFSVKDGTQTYSGGRRVGFVIEAEGGLIGADILNDLEIRTYLDNQLQEIADIGGGNPQVSLELLAGEGSRRRISFLSTQNFDEVELLLTGVANLSLFSALRIYYAYEEVEGCDYNCITALTTTHFPGATATTDCEAFLGAVCIDDGFNDSNNAVNADTTDAASDVFVFLESHYLDIDIGEDIAAGSEVGFAIEVTGFLGLLTPDVLGQIEIETFNDGNPSPVESFILSSPQANVGVFTGAVNLVSVKTSQVFDQVRITIASPLAVLTTYTIYYGFIRPDSDGDGFPDCVDTCVGDNNFDTDGDGTPDDCDTDCAISAGPDFSACPDMDTFMLFSAGAGETWTPLPGNPGPSSVDAGGVVSGLIVQGVYLFELSNGICADTVAVTFIGAQASLNCNDPLAGPGTLVNDNGSCQMCGNVDAVNLVDGDLGNYAEESSLLALSLLGTSTPLVSVRDTLREYSAGSRVGYVMSFPSGVLNLDFLTAFELRIYQDGSLVETAGTGALELLSTDAVGTNGLQRLSFVTSVAFDEVELVVQGGLTSLDLLTSTRVYYAFTSDPSCPDLSNSTDISDICGVALTTGSD